MPIGAGGYGGDDPTLRLARRVKLLTIAYPEISDRPKLLETVAKWDMSDEDMVTKTGELTRLAAFRASSQALSQLDDTTQRTYWSRMDPVSRAGLEKIGYKLPSKGGWNWTSVKIGPFDTADLPGPLKFLPQAVIPSVGIHAVKKGFGLAMEGFDAAQNLSTRAYRTLSAKRGEAPDLSGLPTWQRFALGAADFLKSPLSTEGPIGRLQPDEQLVERSRNEYAMWLLDQAVSRGRLSQTDANRIIKTGNLVQWSETFSDPNIDKGYDLLRAYSGGWADAWAGAKGDHLFRPTQVFAAEEILGHDQGKLQIAARLVNGERPEEILAKRGLVPGTSEYSQESRRLADIVEDKAFKKALKTLGLARVSYGTDIANNLALQPGTTAYARVATAGDLSYTFIFDPTLVGGKAVKSIRVARNVIQAGELTNEISKIRTILSDVDGYVNQFSGARKILARDEVIRATTRQRALERVVDVVANGGARQMLIEQPQLAPLLRAATEENNRLRTIGETLNSTDQMWDLLESHAGIAELLQGSQRSYRYAGRAGGVVLPGIDRVQVIGGRIRGGGSRAIDWMADFKANERVAKMGALAKIDPRSMLGTYGQFLRSWVRTPMRTYLNIDDPTMIKEFLDAGSLYGISSKRQAEILDDIIQGVQTLDDGTKIITSGSQAARRMIVYRYINSVFDELGIRDLAESDKTGRAKRTADALIRRFSDDFVYSLSGAAKALIPEQTSNFIAIPNFVDVARASQLNTFLAKTYRTLTPGVLEWFMSKWRATTVFRPGMGVRAAAEELLNQGIRFGWAEVISGWTVLPATKGERAAGLLKKIRDAEVALKAGNISADALDALRLEYDKYRHGAALAPFLKSMNWLSGHAGIAGNPVQLFATKVADVSTHIARTAIGTVGEIFGPAHYAQMKRAADAILDPTHPAHEAYLELSGAHTAYAGLNPEDTIDRPGLPVRFGDEVEAIPFSVGRGYEAMPTNVTDVVQTMTRSATMTQLGQSVLADRAMETLSRTVTPNMQERVITLLTNQPGWAFDAPTMNEARRLAWEKIDAFPEGIADDMVRVLRGDVQASSKVQTLKDAIKEAQARKDLKAERALLDQLSKVQRGSVASSGTGGVINSIRNMRYEKFGVDGKDASDAFNQLIAFRRKNAQGFDDILQYLDETINNGARPYQWKGPLRTHVDALASILEGNVGASHTQLIDDVKDILSKKVRGTKRKGLLTYVDPNNDWRDVENRAKTFMDQMMKLNFREREAVLVRGGGLVLDLHNPSKPQELQLLRQNLTNDILADMGNNQELLARMDRSYEAIDKDGRAISVAMPASDGMISVYYPVVEVQDADILANLAKYFDQQPPGELQFFLDNIEIPLGNGRTRKLTFRQKQMFSGMMDMFDEGSYLAAKNHAATHNLTHIPVTRMGVGDWNVAQEMADIARVMAGNEYEARSGVIAFMDIRNPKGRIEPATPILGKARTTFEAADLDASRPELKIAGSQAYKMGETDFLAGTILSPADIENGVSYGDTVLIEKVGDPGVATGEALRAGGSKQKAMRMQAEQIADQLITTFTSSKSNTVLHEVVNGMVRDDNDLFMRVASLGVDDLPETTYVPKLYVDVARVGGWDKTKGKFTNMNQMFNHVLEKGFSKFVTPIITSAVRNPLFLNEYGNMLNKSDAVYGVLKQGMDAWKNIDDWAAANGVERELIESIWKGLHPNDRIPDAPLNKIVKAFADSGQQAATVTAGGVSTKVGGGIAITTDDARYLRDNLSQLEHMDRLQQNAAIEGTINAIIPFIDDSRIRTFASELGRGWSPFMYAEQQFLRRWARTLVFDPAAIHKAQLYLGVGESIGLVRTDEVTGKTYFVYPGIGPAMEILSKIPGVGKMLFGGEVQLPKGLVFEQDVSKAIPGMANPGEIGLGPVMTVVSRGIGVFFPEAGGDLYSQTTKGRSITDSLWNSFLPGWAVNVLKSTGSIDDGAERNRVAVQAMQMLAAEGNELLREAQDARKAGNLKLASRLEKRALEILPPEGDADAMTKDHYAETVKSAGRAIMVSRAFTHFTAFGAGNIGGLGVEMTREWQRELNRIDPTETDGYAKALGRFIARYPDALPFTIKGRESESRAPLPNTTYAMQWIRENDLIMRKYPESAPWLVEPDPAGERDARAWVTERAYGLYKQRDVEGWAREYNRAKGAFVYYPMKKKYDDRLAALPDNASFMKKQIRDEWSAVKDDILEMYPVFAEEYASPVARNRRTTQRENILRMRDAGELPNTQFAKNIVTLVEAYNNHMTAIDNLTGMRSRYADIQREELRRQFQAWGEETIANHPELGGFWNAVILPDSDLEG